MGLYIFHLVEGAEEPEFRGGILLSLGERTSVSCGPRRHRFFWKEHADGVGQLAIGSDVENEFRRRGFGIFGKRRALSHEVVLVDVSLSAGVGLQAADGLVFILIRG